MTISSKSFSKEVLQEFLSCQPPHLAMVRAVEALSYERHLPLKGKILDLGCGDGFFAWSVYKRQKIDTGIDVSGSLWSEAEKRGNYDQVVCYEGFKIPFPDNYFDTVVSNCVLEHVPHAAELIKEVFRVLKPKGKFILTVVTDSFGEELLGTKLIGKRYQAWFNKKSVHVAATSAKEWQERLIQAGFKIIESENYLNKDHLIRFLDLTHYWGLVNLITRKLIGKWVWGPSKISNQIWERVFEKIDFEGGETIKSEYMFIAAQK